MNASLTQQKQYGVDVAITRADDLDKKLIEHVEGKVAPRVLDIGSGAGGQSVRLALAGAQVTAVDICDYIDTFEALRTENDLTEESLRFIQGDMSDLDVLLGEQLFDDCGMQRVLHYVPYDTAVKILTQLRKQVQDRLYISVTGLDTAIGLNYKDKENPIESRFSTLLSADAETFSIHEPVCLYSQSEFETLLTDAGWEVFECWVSAFGNIKAVCV